LATIFLTGRGGPGAEGGVHLATTADPIHRRAALALLGAGALSACGPPPRPKPGILYGRAVSNTPPKSPWDEQWIHFKGKIAKDPSIQLAYFNRSETGPEEQQMFDIRRGRAHLGGPSLQGLSSVVPELTIAMAPFLFSSEAEVDFVYDRYLKAVFDPLFAAKGLKLLQWVEVGWTNLYSNGAVLLPADAAGRRLRGSPNRAAQGFLRAIGADSVPLGATELVPALQTGLIDGGLGATVFHFFSTRDYATDFTLTRHSYDTGAIIANLEWWQGATDSQRDTIGHAWMSSVEARQSVRKLTAFALSDMKKRGVRLHELTPEQRARWIAATANVAPALIAEIGGASGEVWAAIQAGKKAFAALSSAPGALP
jgi:TRAP-type transport system periplasmic protein